jgi:predicted ATPase/DNA-binding SARP family transcriptional activator
MGQVAISPELAIASHWWTCDLRRVGAGEMVADRFSVVAARGVDGPAAAAENTRICAWCGQLLPALDRPGPAARFCRPSHRQRAYEARRKRRVVAIEATDTATAAPPEGRAPANGWGAGQRHGQRVPAIRILRPAAVVDASGREVTLSPKLGAVLVALVARPRQVVSVETLTDSLWPGVDEAVARRRLHTAVWKLRKLIGPPSAAPGGLAIRWSPPGLVLDVTEDRLDWTRFQRLHGAGAAALARGNAELARTYLGAALSLWGEPEPLGGVAVTADDLGFVTRLVTARAKAAATYVEACFGLGDWVRALPEIETLLAADPMDAHLVGLLVAAHYALGDRTAALQACRRYLDGADSTAVPSGARTRVEELQRALLRREPWVGRHPDPSGSQPRPGGDATNGAFLAASWGSFTPVPGGPLPAELVLLTETYGGTVVSVDDTRVEASFMRVAQALGAAGAIVHAMGEPPLARVGVAASPPPGHCGSLAGAPRARARLLLSAAAEGQVLLTGTDLERPSWGPLPEGGTLKPLGIHRLNALTPPAPVFQLAAPELADVRTPPHWFDRTAVHNLVEEPFRFIGRARETTAALGALAESRLVTLTGPPGSGKTRVAGQVAAALSGEYGDGAWFVALQPVTDGHGVVAAVANSLSIPKPAAVTVDTLIAALRDRHALVVLDNCEHVVVACRELVDHLLPACPGLSVLATSREELHCRFERSIWVPPLEPPGYGSSQVILENEAVQLFYDRWATNPSGGVRDPAGPADEVNAVARICRQVEGLPLALVLAAARARELGAPTLADLLDQPSSPAGSWRILSTANGDRGPHATLDGTLEWSHRLLGERDRITFDCLSVFRAPFTWDDVAAVCVAPGLLAAEELSLTLDRLVQVSLVVPCQAGRFRLLEPVRQFAQTRLAARPTCEAAARRRHAAHFLGIAEAAEPRIRGPQDPDTLDRLDASLPDLYAALRWSIDEGESSTALRLVGALWVFWLVRGRMVEGLPLVEMALATDQTPNRERAKALTACSQLAWFTGDLARARESCRELLFIAEATGDELAWAWAPLGLVAHEMFGDDDTVLVRAEETLPAFRRLGNDWDTGQAIQTLGGAAWHRGHYEYAERVLAESVALYRSLGHPTLMASLLAHGLMLALLGQLDAGAAEVEASIDASYVTGDLGVLGYALCHRGAIARYAGRTDQARSYFRDALVTGRDAGSMWAVQWSLAALAGTEELGPGSPSSRFQRSVQLLACAESLARHTGIILPPREREYREQDLARARARLGPAAFETARATGLRLGLVEAIDLALEPRG